VKYSIAFISLILFLAGCRGPKEIKDGTLAFDLKKYHLAQQLLPGEISAASNDEDKLNKIQLIAQSYELSNQPHKAEDWYQRGYDISNRPEWLFDLAIVQKRVEKYEEALANFRKYKSITYDAFRSDSEIDICIQAIEAKSGKSNIVIENLEPLNTTKSDYATAFYKDNALLLTSTRESATGNLMHPWTGEKNSDIFISFLKNGKYQNPQGFSEVINTDLPEGSITFSADYKEAYFTRCSYSETENSYCKIYHTKWEAGDWTDPELLPIFHDTVNVGHPFLSPDGKRLFFVSDAPFGYGARDIYFLQKTADGWSDPFNVGFQINTVGDELFPTVDSKGNLYFSTNGKSGFGGLDIYKAEPDKNNFKNPERLPFPINSGGDDFLLLWVKEFTPNPADNILEQAIFSSSRPGGKGNDDIYSYTKKYINYYELKLYIVEKQFEDPENSDSKILGLIPLNKADVQLIPNVQKPEKIGKTTDKTGLLIFELSADTEYKIMVSKNDYFNQSVVVSTKGIRSPDSLVITLIDTVELEKIFPEKEIVIPNIYYDYDKASLRPESLPVLDKLVEFFNENNDLTIEIGSHTDSRGSDAYNLNLSQRRAQSVVDYLISKGVPESQLTAKGYGETKLVNHCANNVPCSEEEHQQNRRTTFRVISASGLLQSE
jgi:peptidoglycan-associated lipoprotein